MNCAAVVVLYYLLDSFTFAEQKSFKLELVQALFRHGDRIPDKGEVYKTDPYDPEFYRAIGYGQLTDIGMLRAYQVGQLLKRRYDDFLGEYNAELVCAYDTGRNRTKASLQLVLAGLFDSTSTGNFFSHSRSHFFLDPTIFGHCPKFIKLLNEAERLPEVKAWLDQYSDFLKYVTASTGLGRSHIFSIILIASNLQAVQSMGLELPLWISKKEYKKLLDIIALFWDVMSFTQELRIITVGPLVEKFLKNMKNREKADKRKIYLYSGHDMHVALFTRAHNFTEIPGNPAYGSTVIVETLRGSDDEFYVRMFLWTGVSEKLIELKLENCDYECPLAEYEKLVKSLIPGPEFSTCSRDISLDDVQSRKGVKLHQDFKTIYWNALFKLFGADVSSLKYANEADIYQTIS